MEDVVGLAASVDLQLDDAQILALESGVAEADNGDWAADQVALIEPRQNGKTALLSARALGGTLLFKEQLIVWTAHRLSTALESFRIMRGLVTDYDHLRKRVKGRPHRTTFGTGEIEFLNGCRVLFLARAAGASGRGLSAETLFLDEAYDLTDDDLAALLPALSARPNHQVWYTSSAPKPHSEVLRRICLAGRYSKSARLAYLEWSASDDAQSDDRDAWRQANPTYGVRITEETILGELAAMSDEDFRRERLGIWSEVESGSMIDPRRWADMKVEWQPGRPVAFGVDIAPERNWAAINAYGHRDDGIGQVRLVEYRAGTDWVVPKLVELKGLKPVGFAMARGTYESLKQALAEVGIRPPEDPEKPRRSDLAVLNGTDMAAACGQLIDAVRQGTIRQVPSPQQDAAVAGARTRRVGDVVAWSRKDATVDITPLVGLTEARWLYEAWHELVDKTIPRSKVY